MSGVYALAVADFGGAVAWVVPTYKNSRPVWRFIEQQAKRSPLIRVLRSDKIVEFPSGGRVSVYSADSDADSIRSDAFDLAIVDEAARVTEEAVYDAIMPTLADSAGRLMAISTPKGRNWFYRDFMRAKGGAADMFAVKAPTYANPLPNIRAAYLLAKERVSARTFAQEWNAEFVDDTGGVFRNVRLCSTATPQSEPFKDHFYAFGVDWGRTTDSTVITVIDTTLRACVYLDRFTEVDWTTQLMRLQALADKFRPYIVWAEANSMGGPLTEELSRRDVPVVPFTTTNDSKRSIIDALALALERQDIHIVPDETMINELEAYEVTTTGTGLVKMGAPPGLHDDCVMSLALAWQACTRGALFL